MRPFETAASVWVCVCVPAVRWLSWLSQPRGGEGGGREISPSPARPGYGPSRALGRAFVVHAQGTPSDPGGHGGRGYHVLGDVSYTTAPETAL